MYPIRFKNIIWIRFTLLGNDYRNASVEHERPFEKSKERVKDKGRGIREVSRNASDALKASNKECEREVKALVRVLRRPSFFLNLPSFPLWEG